MSFVKFPQTPYLLSLEPHKLRNDKLLEADERSVFFGTAISVEEKVDGTNIGFSLSNDGTILVQNRGAYVDPDSHAQFRKLKSWIKEHESELFELLFPDRILYGEWSYAKHTIPYEWLPDWFLAFDIYETTSGNFVSRDVRHNFLRSLRIHEVPFIKEKTFDNESQIQDLLERQSVLYNGPVEGVYLRLEDNDKLLRRAKIVRPEFTQSIEEHWTRQALHINGMKRAETVSVDIF